MWSEEWLDLVLPRSCRGCARPGALFCRDCLAGVGAERASLRAPIDRGPSLFAAGGEHVGLLRSALLAHKQRRHRAIAAALCALLGRSLGVVADVLRAHGSWAAPIALVPIPPSSRWGGRQPVVELLRPLVSAIPGLVLGRWLSTARSRRPQKGLDAAGRAANVDGAFRYLPQRRGQEPAMVILVDDVVTTGASMASAHGVLVAAGRPPIAAIAVTTADVVGR